MSPFLLGILASTVVYVLSADPSNPGDGDKPMVAFVPDWRKMFYNETLTIACLGGNGQQAYTWYRNNNKLDKNQQNFTIDSIQLYDRANYQCQVGKGPISDQIRQHVITDLAILRVPRYVFEGDILTFPCDSRLDMNTTDAKVTFYKNFKYLKDKGTETSLFLGRVDSSTSGKYKCVKEAYLNGVRKSSEDEEDIEITELFSSPELKIYPNPIQVGSNMTLTCVTVLHPLRAATELQFAFYRSGWHVQGFSSSKTFTIPSVSLEDSGDYACEVQTLTNSVRKMSMLSSIQVQDVRKPTVVFYPNWDKILRNEQIGIRCNAPASDWWRQTYTWYKNNNIMTKTIQSFNIYSAGDNDIGSYQCQISSGEKSDPVHLDVFFVWLILQAPHSIHEGDVVSLNCHMWRSGVAKNTTFYKDDKMIKFLDNLSELNLGVVSKDTGGKYKCTKYINTGSASKIYTAEEFISVAELFSTPEVMVSPYSTIEGADMTLTCHTVRSPRRLSTELRIAFYKDGQPVQNLGTSDKYEIQSVQPKDSGNYTCKVQNVPGTVVKTSKVSPIQIQGMAVVAFKPNVGKIFTGAPMSFFCNVDSNMKGDQIFYWSKDNVKMQETQQEFTIRSASVNDSGYYQCRSSVTHLSDPVRLDVSNSDLILQAPPIINEGDDLILGCHHRSHLEFAQVEFYKDGVFKKILDSESDLRLGKAYKNISGSYRCTKSSKSPFRMFTAEVFVSVTELFPYMKLQASQDVIVEGESVVLSCQTTLNSALSPLRGKTELQFAFYRDGRNVQPFNTADQYKIASAQKKDSGNYTCEVKSTMNSVTKMSQPLSVDVQELFTAPNLLVNENPLTIGFVLILTCDTTINPNRQKTNLEYTFYKNGKALQKLKFFTRYRSGQITEDHAGEYSCEVSSSSNNVSKRSNTMKITVQVPIGVAKIRMDGQDSDMTSGLSLTFKCSVYTGTDPSFTWFHNGKELNQNCVLYNITHDGKTLFINSTQPRHSGTYRCQAKNSFSSSMSSTLTINVTAPATMAARSEEVKCQKTEKANPYVVPALIVVLVVVVLTLAVIYRYRHRLPIPKFPFHQEQVDTLGRNDEDSLLSLENIGQL